MSKTIRRKDVSDIRILNKGWCSQKHNDCPKGVHCRLIDCSVNCPYRDKKHTISEFHRDTHSNYGWKGHAPKAFNKEVNRIKKAKMKAEVRRIMIQGDYDNYSFDPWKHDAGWMYW